MADAHGLLARPGRLLTLWTSYGGVPRYWERFVRNGTRLRDFLEMPDGDTWRHRFIADERKLLDGYGERYDSGVYIEFRGLAREALLALADTRAKALPTKDLERGLEEVIAKLEATDPLTPTLGMVLNSLEEGAQALRADRMRLADAWQDDPANLRRVAFSPVLPARERARLVDAGLDCIDILDMAAAHGFGPKSGDEGHGAEARKDARGR